MFLARRLRGQDPLCWITRAETALRKSGRWEKGGTKVFSVAGEGGLPTFRGAVGTPCNKRSAAISFLTTLPPGLGLDPWQRRKQRLKAEQPPFLPGWKASDEGGAGAVSTDCKIYAHNFLLRQ